MKIKNLTDERDYDAALKRADELFMAQSGTPEGDELASLLLAIKEYEDKHYPVI